MPNRALMALLGALVLVLPASCGNGASPRAAGPAGRGVRVWAVGDGGNGTPEAKRVAARIAKDDPKRVLYLGDVYETGTAADFRHRFAPVYGGVGRRMEATPRHPHRPPPTRGHDPDSGTPQHPPTPHPPA